MEIEATMMVGPKWGRAGLFGALLAALMAVGVARSDEDHDRARQALESGEVLPLRTILERVETEYPGQIMAVELEQRDGHWIYEIKVLRTGGDLVKLLIDGRDGRLLGSKRHGAGARHGGGEN
jgi:uncharacterized membrane protein YkoI